MNVRKKIMAAMPWSRAAALAAEADAADAEKDGGTVALITADPQGPQGPSGHPGLHGQPGNHGLLADLAAKVYAGQERLAMELAASGKSREQIFEALYEDLKTRKAEAAAQKPQPTTQEVAAEVLKELRAGAPPAPATVEAAEPNIYEQFAAISDPAQASAFYRAHKEEIQRIMNSSQPTKKEVP